VGIVVLTGTDATDRVQTQYHRLTRSEVGQTGDFRDRLTNPGINRVDRWNVALDAFRDAPLKGQGAGTYVLRWNRDRPTASNSAEGHSLYLEQLGELGLVGVVLLVAALLALVVGVIVQVRGRERALFAAVFAAMLMWALHAGIDWDWEVPAVTLWVFMLGGAAVARSANGRGPPTPRPTRVVRGAMALGCVALAATPVLVGVSQGRLVEGARAFDRGDCALATQKADDSLSALGDRPEPYEILSYCNALSGRSAASIEAMQAAIKRDPRNWKYRYGLALVRAATGRDPRHAARQAVRLNPKERRARVALARFRSSNPAAWRRAAHQIGLSLR
jgi:hypothetical protein